LRILRLLESSCFFLSLSCRRSELIPHFGRILTIGMLVLLCTLGMTVSSQAMDIQEGEWETTIEMVIEGLPFSIPPMKSTQCLTQNEPLPENSAHDCRVKERQTTGNTLNWAVTCQDRRSTSEGSGEITYAGKSYQGNMLMVVTQKGEEGRLNRMTMKLSGRHLGPCAGGKPTSGGHAKSKI
jgi:hypothetical protein